MKKVKYGYDELRRFLVLFGVVLVLGYFILYVIGHWELLVRFWESNSQAEINRVISQLRHKTILNFVVLVILTAVTAAIPFMSNAVFAIFNGVVYGPYIGFGMNLLGNVLGNFIFIKLLNVVDISDSENKLKKRFSGIQALENKNYGIILGYMIPVVPTILINYHVAEEKLPWRKWLPYVTIGVAPSSLIYALGGDAVIAGNVRRLIVLGVIIALGYVLVTVIRRRNNNKMQKESAA
ncbi:TVP38/TMEM64 family protein [Streptococcus alactolyticus]|uniref:TVP38/TMEM64 family protein n=1 Tax=Streptococcus alactolyticus TaxID=29389 RepID=UPI003CFC2E0A